LVALVYAIFVAARDLRDVTNRCREQSGDYVRFKYFVWNDPMTGWPAKKKYLRVHH